MEHPTVKDREFYRLGRRYMRVSPGEPEGSEWIRGSPTSRTDEPKHGSPPRGSVPTVRRSD